MATDCQVEGAAQQVRLMTSSMASLLGSKVTFLVASNDI
jgi:hypothetical protein